MDIKDINYYGLIVGVNQYADRELEALQYAEKDANDLYNVLTDPETGKFPRVNVDLLLGDDARLNDIQITLVDKVVKRENTDTVLIYFAGHAISVEDKIYLVPSDVSKFQVQNNRLKHISISLDSLREDVFRASRAKNIIFILDTCYSGSLLPKERGDQRSDFTSQILKTFPQTQTAGQHDQIRSIIVSSEPSSPSMEYAALKNGVFTHHLLAGLQGGAIDYESGNVTIDALLNYVKTHVPEGQKPGGYINGYGGVVLVHHENHSIDREAIKYFSFSEINKLAVHPEFIPFTNHLEPYQEFIMKLAEHLKDSSQLALPPEERVMSAFRISADAEMALVLDKHNDRWDLSIKNQRANLKSDEIIKSVVPTLLAGIHAQNEILTANRIGSFSRLNVSQKTMNAIAIPVNIKGSQKVVVLVFREDIENPDLFRNDLFAQILSGIYYALEQIQSFDAYLIEAHLLDYLKMFNKYMPSSLYDQRINLFNRRLRKMSVRFQPIIYLGMEEPFVCGFETLASDPETNKTPLDLLKAAEIWGTRFKIDLDSHFFETGLITYRKRLDDTRGYQRPNDILDLSINVYPETLLRSAYYAKVSEILGKKLIPTYRLYLEISEKSPNPEVIPGDGIATKGMTTFRDILKKYVRDFQIGFAIDDFGIGESSVERLADLTPSYIKIDRKLTTLPTAYETIKYTVDFIEEIVSARHLSSSKIVLEGFDEEIVQLLSLGRLMQLGIKFIQSYIIGMPTDKLARLEKEQIKYLLSLMKR